MITMVDCFGICRNGPIMVIYPEGIWYNRLNEKAIHRIVNEHILGGIPVMDYIFNI
jgi:(2Fe-2S) ferredoxin